MARHWYQWIYHRVKTNAPYDKIVEGLIMATSRQKGEDFMQFAKGMSQHFKKEDPVPFHTRESMPYYWARRNVRQAEEKALSFAHSFLGVRIQCAQCHKHPFDQWTQQDFKKFQAFFEPIQFRANTTKADKTEGSMNYQNLMKEIETAVGYDKVKKNNRRELRDEIRRRAEAGKPVPWQELYVTGTKGKPRRVKNKAKKKPVTRVITPSVLGGDNVHLTEYSDPRQPLMDWLRSSENPYFAQAFVNRVWFNYFGHGIVHPVDDMNLANPPSNKPLMDYLTGVFVHSGYDIKWLHRTILNSDAYQRSWRPNETNKYDNRNFSRMTVRRLPAEVVADAINQATASESRLLDLITKPISRTIGPDAINLRNSHNVTSMIYALNVFGKPERAENCDCERSNDPTLLQAIFTRNDPSLNAMVEGRDRKKPGWIAELDRKYNGDRIEKPNSKKNRQLKQLYRQRKALVEYAPNKPKENSQKAQDRFTKAIKEHRKKLKSISSAIKNLNGTNKKRISQTEPLSPEVIDQLISETFLRTVSRYPTPLERANAQADVKTAKNKIHGIKNLLWALLNTKEFLVNH